MSEIKFKIIGLTDSGKQFFSPEILTVINSGNIFSGGIRHHEIVKDFLPPTHEWIDVTVPLDKVYKEYLKYKDIVIFASGDPLFYGIAATLKREFPDSDIKVYPAFNSLQMLAHRLLIPYAAMVNVSCTGRDWHEFDSAVIQQKKYIGVLTDRKKTPREISGRLLDYGYENYKIFIGEKLGNDQEKIKSLSLKEAAVREFQTPNCLILERLYKRKRYFGIPESEFFHLENRSNMITKMPVRLLSISMLDLYDRKVLWDIGFCTGSVSIEAKLQFPDLKVIAFEKRKESETLMEKNIRKFGTPGIDYIIGDFMDCDLSQYPSPDAVFIGGHGGNLEEVIDKIFKYLNPGGVIVFNSVREENCELFRKAVEKNGAMVSASHTMKLDNHNPITVMQAI